MTPGDRVRVHYNLHLAAKREKARAAGDTSPMPVWVIAAPSGKVLAHVEYVELRDAECRVQEGARKRVLETRARSVHAYVVGTLVAAGVRVPVEDKSLEKFSYNPYRAAHFRAVESGVKVVECAVARFDQEGAWFR